MSTVNTVIVGVIALAIVAVVLSKRAQTVGMVNDIGGTLAGVIGKAVAA